VLAALGGYFGSKININMGFREMVPHDLESMQVMDWVEDNLYIDLLDAAPVIILIEADDIEASIKEVGLIWSDLEDLDNVRRIRPEFPEEDAPVYGKAILTHIYLTEPL
jgi:hypothetical protein